LTNFKTNLNQEHATLSVADELLKANETFARNFTLGDLAVRPKRHVAVLACMDSRILFEHCLGLHPGDAHMIRNAGGIATDDALRSLIVSHHLLDTQEFIIINHTDCGLLKVREDELKAAPDRKDGSHRSRARALPRLRRPGSERAPADAARENRTRGFRSTFRCADLSTT
jgi:carbonic anhydrase